MATPGAADPYAAFAQLYGLGCLFCGTTSADWEHMGMLDNSPFIVCWPCSQVFSITPQNLLQRATLRLSEKP